MAFSWAVLLHADNLYGRVKFGGEVGRGDGRQTASQLRDFIHSKVNIFSSHISEIRIHFSVDGNDKLMGNIFSFLEIPKILVYFKINENYNSSRSDDGLMSKT